MGRRWTSGFAALVSGGRIEPYGFDRRALGIHDIALRIAYCGVCHTDLHSIHDDDPAAFPLVPGHEIAGEIVAVGTGVTFFKPGDRALIGTIVDSCRSCEPCRAQQENYCREFPTLTYNGTDRVDGSRTRGGYAREYVADERFVHHLPAGMNMAAAAPLLCAGITTYSPLRHWNVGPQTTVGIVGIGGLGHLGVKFARALGAQVVAFTSSQAKAAAALALGAHEVVLSSDPAQMAAQAFRFDFILDCVARPHALTPYVKTLGLNGTLCLLGIPDRLDVEPVALTMGRRSVASSGVGGTAETREMLAFCALHGIVADVEIVTPDAIDTAYERLAAGDVRYRFVVDLRATA